jgi:putative restriction endonuclease
MGTLTIELPSQEAQREFNERRWAELLDDPDLARFEGRIETDRHGRIIMNPPPAVRHGRLQSAITYLLHTHASGGSVVTECPISTADGVRAADIAWASDETMRALGDRVSFPRAPEVCVKVPSPRNTKSEIREKTALFFDAGASEVWICAESGAMTFLAREDQNAPMHTSKLFPEFPAHITLR